MGVTIVPFLASAWSDRGHVLRKTIQPLLILSVFMLKNRKFIFIMKYHTKMLMMKICNIIMKYAISVFLKDFRTLCNYKLAKTL